MEEEDDKVSRKHRRRSVRNIRRQSGIVPFNLNTLDEEETKEQTDDISSQPSQDDMYGSLWMESQEPVKKRKKRRSSLFVGLSARLPSPVRDDADSALVADNRLEVVTDCNGLVERERLYQVCRLQDRVDNDLNNGATQSCETIENSEIDMKSGVDIESRPDFTARTENENDIVLSKEKTENSQCNVNIVSDVKNHHSLKNLSESDLNSGAKLNVESIANDIEQNLNGSLNFNMDLNSGFVGANTSSTPGSNHGNEDNNITTPASMSPDFPVSPSGILYLGSPEDSYVDTLTASCDKSATVSADEVVSIKTVEKQVARLDTSEKDLSDKENSINGYNSCLNVTPLENEENTSKTSPGFLSMCKAFAGKVVNFVKTSPSFLVTSSSQDTSNVSINCASPVLKAYVDENVNYSPKTLKRAKQQTEVDDILDRMENDLNSEVKTYTHLRENMSANVQTVSTADGATRHVPSSNILALKYSAKTENTAETTLSKSVKKKRDRKTFFDTFNAVSNELHRHRISESTPDNEGMVVQESDAAAKTKELPKLVNETAEDETPTEVSEHGIIAGEVSIINDQVLDEKRTEQECCYLKTDTVINKLGKDEENKTGPSLSETKLNKDALPEKSEQISAQAIITFNTDTCPTKNPSQSENIHEVKLKEINEFVDVKDPEVKETVPEISEIEETSESVDFVPLGPEAGTSNDESHMQNKIERNIEILETSLGSPVHNLDNLEPQEVETIEKGIEIEVKQVDTLDKDNMLVSENNKTETKLNSDDLYTDKLLESVNTDKTNELVPNNEMINVHVELKVNKENSDNEDKITRKRKLKSSKTNEETYANSKSHTHLIFSEVSIPKSVEIKKAKLNSKMYASSKSHTKLISSEISIPKSVEIKKAKLNSKMYASSKSHTKLISSEVSIPRSNEIKKAKLNSKIPGRRKSQKFTEINMEVTEKANDAKDSTSVPDNEVNNSANKNSKLSEVMKCQMMEQAMSEFDHKKVKLTSKVGRRKSQKFSDLNMEVAEKDTNVKDLTNVLDSQVKSSAIGNYKQSEVMKGPMIEEGMSNLDLEKETCEEVITPSTSETDIAKRKRGRPQKAISSISKKVENDQSEKDLSVKISEEATKKASKPKRRKSGASKDLAIPSHFQKTNVPVKECTEKSDIGKFVSNTGKASVIDTQLLTQDMLSLELKEHVGKRGNSCNTKTNETEIVTEDILGKNNIDNLIQKDDSCQISQSITNIKPRQRNSIGEAELLVLPEADNAMTGTEIKDQVSTSEGNNLIQMETTVVFEKVTKKRGRRRSANFNDIPKDLTKDVDKFSISTETKCNETKTSSPSLEDKIEMSSLEMQPQTSSMRDTAQEITVDNLELPEDIIVPKRRRRRSADAATLKIQMVVNDENNDSPITADYINTGPTTSIKPGRKRKMANENTLEELEKLYKNKNFVKPEEKKPWQTIYESPNLSGDLFGKKRLYRFSEFEKPSQVKYRRRLQKAAKNGWDPKKRRKQELNDDFVHEKISNLFSELDTELSETESLESKLKKIVDTD